jgi:hypothetical protein
MPDKSSVSKANTYQGIGEFWDEHDASEFGEQRAVKFTVNIQSERRYYPINNEFSSIIRQTAQEHGISGETLVNLWVQEKINQINSEQESEQAAPPDTA